jgi:transcription elongation factor Elf1
MPIRYLDPERYNAGKPAAADADADWNGNNAAFTCPVCSKVFVVSAFINTAGLHCPGCGKSTAYVTGSAIQGREAWIEWSFDEKAKRN